MIQQINSCNQQIFTIKKTLASEQASLKEQEDELYNETRQKDELDEKLEELDEQIAELQRAGDKLLNEL